MVTHMKTTIELSDEVLARAWRQAEREGKTLREVVEQALRQHLDAPDAGRAFKLKRRPFKGKGRQPGGAEGDWQSVRDLIYRIG
jgi:Arc/MetJ family transcription regulator